VDVSRSDWGGRASYGTQARKKKGEKAKAGGGLVNGSRGKERDREPVDCLG